MKKLLLCTGGWSGDRYLSAFLAMKPRFEGYAAACGAEMGVIDHPLDPEGRRTLFTQKLLIPRTYGRYDVVAHMDLDVLIPRNLPSIFDALPAEAGFGAVVDPRGSFAFQKAWGFADWTRMSHKAYFESLGLSSERELASINAGVVVFRPGLVADMFAAWYFDDARYAHKSEGDYSSEEVPLAYLSQDAGLFAPLEYRFNRQVFFALHETSAGKAAYRDYRSFVNRARRKARKALGFRSAHVGFGPSYTLFVEDLLKDGNLVHFAGKYPVPEVNQDLLVRSQ
ncbi:MAG TPA: hypothetical protein VL354_15250 [Spirochaetia bacterium]|nr:hypothetical protein [Spirochaetia bacterium]